MAAIWLFFARGDAGAGDSEYCFAVFLKYGSTVLRRLALRDALKVHLPLLKTRYGEGADSPQDLRISVFSVASLHAGMPTPFNTTTVLRKLSLSRAPHPIKMRINPPKQMSYPTLSVDVTSRGDKSRAHFYDAADRPLIWLRLVVRYRNIYSVFP